MEGPVVVDSWGRRVDLILVIASVLKADFWTKNEVFEQLRYFLVTVFFILLYCVFFMN